MKKITTRQPENGAQDKIARTDSDGQQKGYNEQNPSQPQGSFRPDGHHTRKTKPTSATKRAAQKKR